MNSDSAPQIPCCPTRADYSYLSKGSKEAPACLDTGSDYKAEVIVSSYSGSGAALPHRAAKEVRPDRPVPRCDTKEGLPIPQICIGPNVEDLSARQGGRDGSRNPNADLASQESTTVLEHPNVRGYLETTFLSENPRTQSQLEKTEKDKVPMHQPSEVKGLFGLWILWRILGLQYQEEE
jgi:hypothetical protein